MHENVSAFPRYAECGRESNKFLLAWLAEWMQISGQSRHNMPWSKNPELPGRLSVVSHIIRQFNNQSNVSSFNFLHSVKEFYSDTRYFRTGLYLEESKRERPYLPTYIRMEIDKYLKKIISLF